MKKIHLELLFYFINIFAFSQNQLPELQYIYPNFKSSVRSVSVSLNEEPTVINGIAVPSDFPVFEQTIEGNTAPGYLFLSNWSGTPYIMILENDGTPFYYQRVEALSIDFKLQPSGLLTRNVRKDFYAFVSMDQNYNIIDTFMCQNGYETDEHEIQLLENGHALMIGNESRIIDMSKLVEGGRTNATVVGNHVQEIDENNNVVFEFNCWDNFEITGAVGIDLTGFIIDYVHMNSIAIDFDSNIIISSRHLSECTKINRQTGEIMWRLGGKFNQFEFINEDVMLDYQHNIQPVPDIPGNYTIFDNGNNRGYTRVVEYQIDTNNMTATKVWEYRHSPDRLCRTMGNAQRLPNGNTLINWAEADLPKATEVNMEGEVIYEGDFVLNTAGYRTFRFEWNGFLEQPYLIIEPLPDKTRLIFNKFGDDNVVEYRIYGGTSISSIDFITSTNDTWIDLSDLQNRKIYYFKVTSVDKQGNESNFSNLDSIYTRYSIQGENLVQNGDFSEGTNHWGFYLYGNAQAEGTVNQDSQFVFNITNGGTTEVGVQLRQNNIPLIEGFDYVFEFDAIADNSRTIVAKIGQDEMPYTNYSKIGTTSITNQNKKYIYEFTMDYPTDINSRVVFNCGNNSNNVIIDNVSVYIKKEEEPNYNNVNTLDFPKIYIYPNPVKDIVNLEYFIPVSGIIKLSIFDITGKQLFQKDPIITNNLSGNVILDMQEIQPGVYLCSFEFLPDFSEDKIVVIQKIVIY